MPGQTVELAKFKPIAQYTNPVYGDFVIYHGLLWGHWFGIVNGMSASGMVSIIRSGLPLLVFSMNESEMKKNAIQIKLRDIQQSKGGKFAILQGGIWHV